MSLIDIQITSDKAKDIHDYVGIYLEPFLGVLTFFLGYLLSKIITTKQEVSKLKKVYQYFSVYFTSQLSNIREQIKFIKEAAREVSKLKNTSGLDIKLINQPYFILDTINKEDLLDSWIRVGRKEPIELIKTLKFIEFTKVSFNGYMEYHRKFLERQFGIRNKWNASIDSFHKLKAQMVANGNVNTPEIQKLNEIYNNWIDQNSKFLSETVDNLTKPILEYFTPLYEREGKDMGALMLIQKAQEIEIVYLEWMNEVGAYVKYLKYLHKSLYKEVTKVG